jgi:hypothetical protein
VVPVMLAVGFSLPRLGLGDTAAGRLSGRAVNAILSSTAPTTESAPQPVNSLSSPEAASAEGSSASNSPSIPDTPAAMPSDAAGSNSAVSTAPIESAANATPTREPALAPTPARKIPDSAEVGAENTPVRNQKIPVAPKSNVVQVTHRENLFEFALENYGKSSREIVDDIRQLNPQITGPYDMLKAGERIKLPDESGAATAPDQTR